MKWLNIEDFKGLTLSSIDNNGDSELLFTFTNGKRYKMYHEQDCCEEVTIDDINGNLDDLIGTPILLAESVNNDEFEAEFEKTKSEYEESYTWTFYKLATVKGYVTLRWFGSSNGYYSESVDIVDVDV